MHKYFYYTIILNSLILFASASYNVCNCQCCFRTECYSIPNTTNVLATGTCAGKCTNRHCQQLANDIISSWDKHPPEFVSADGLGHGSTSLSDISQSTLPEAVPVVLASRRAPSLSVSQESYHCLMLSRSESNRCEMNSPSGKEQNKDNTNINSSHTPTNTEASRETSGALDISNTQQKRCMRFTHVQASCKKRSDNMHSICCYVWLIVVFSLLVWKGWQCIKQCYQALHS